MAQNLSSETDTERVAQIERELALYQAAFDEIPDAIVLKDHKGDFLLCNQAVARLYNTTPEAMKGKHDGDFGVPKEMADAFRQNVCEIMAKGETEVVFENSRDAVTGEIRNFKSIKRPFKDHAGNNQILVIAHDITDVVQAQQRVAESEKRLQNVMAATREGIWDWQVSTDQLIHNAEWYRMIGFAEGEIADNIEAYSARIHPDDKASVWSRVQALLNGASDDYYSEHRMLCKDGSIIWVQDRGRIAEYDAAGKPVRVVGSVVAITERVEASKRIAGLMAQLDLILALNPDGIVYFNEQGEISFTNQAFESMTGISREAAAGISWDAFLGKLSARADPQQTFPEITTSAANHEPASSLLYLIEPQRRIVQISVHAPHDGNVRVAYMRDVTREIDVDRMKSDFLSTAAHELRTPMTSILGFVELLQLRDFSQQRTSGILDTIHRQAKRLTDLVNELLDLARIEARSGKVFNLQPASLIEIVRDSVNAQAVEAGSGRLALDLPDKMPTIMADPAKLQQALLNLLSNAHKYSPGDSPIEISLQSRVHEDKEQAGVIIRDHGIGMSSEDVARVFERFFRADRSCNVPGTGLGMALVKEVITAHGGLIEIDSALGQGTTVSLWLPPAPEQMTGDSES